MRRSCLLALSPTRSKLLGAESSTLKRRPRLEDEKQPSESIVNQSLNLEACWETRGSAGEASLLTKEPTDCFCPSLPKS